MGKYCSYGVVYFGHGDGGMQILTVLFFQPPRHIRAMSVGGYHRL